MEDIDKSLEIGKSFKFMDNRYVVVEDRYMNSPCMDCAFENTKCEKLMVNDMIPYCFSAFRKDNKMVKFIKLE